MFMVKDEFASIKNLLRVRIKTQARNFVWFFVVMALILVGTLAGTVIGIIRSDAVSYYNIGDYSTWFLVGMLAGYIIQIAMYRNTNNKLSVYPQTNNSRFISSLLFNIAWVLTLALSVVAIYLIKYGVLSLFSVFIDNIHFALNFDIGFVVAGFFVYAAYSLLFVAVAELIGVILRKWTYYAMVVFTAATSLLVINIMAVIEHTPSALAFLIHEPSLTLFFIKAVGLWLVITAVSLVINFFTVYHKSRNHTVKRSAVIVCIILASAIMIVVPLLWSSMTEDDLNITVSEVSSWPVADFFSEAEEIRIDISHLPSGSNLYIEGENINIVATGLATVFTAREFTASVSGTGSLEMIEGDTLIIRFLPPFFNVNGIELFSYANPRVTAYLEGNTLYIEYSVDNVQVVIMPIWGIVRQFDCFRDRGLLPAHILGYMAGGRMNANINILVE